MKATVVSWSNIKTFPSWGLGVDQPMNGFASIHAMQHGEDQRWPDVRRPYRTVVAYFIQVGHAYMRIWTGDSLLLEEISQTSLVSADRMRHVRFFE